MSLFKLSSWMTKWIDRYQRSFLWVGSSTSNGLTCKVNWKSMCLSKEGDLEIKDLEMLNLYLLSKWGWQMLSSEDGLWKKQIHLAYHKRLRLSAT